MQEAGWQADSSRIRSTSAARPVRVAVIGPSLSATKL